MNIMRPIFFFLAFRTSQKSPFSWMTPHMIGAVCAIACLFTPAFAEPRTSGTESAAEARTEKNQAQQQSITAAEWFTRYDEIRRRAEMTIVEKLQSFGLAFKKADKRNAALASRMIRKYTTALSAMKELESTPETKELQDGYIEYFTAARQLMTDCLDVQEQVPSTNQSLMSTKRELEELDKKNKKLDAELRRKYVISKHKHI
jgi:hypothetical protein